MFGRKKDEKTGADGSKQMTPLGLMRKEIEDLSEGQALYYKLGKVYWGGLGGYAIVEISDQHPKKGKKYVISSDDIQDDRPVGFKKRLWTSSKPKEIAEWILDKDGVRHTESRPFNRAA